jgi:NAD(P)H-hydrate epimerase
LPSTNEPHDICDRTMIYLTREQVRSIDRIAAERYFMPGVILMENAARAVADTAVVMLGEPNGAEVLVVCGGGNNGGDGLAAARHLHNHGAKVSIALTTDPSKYQNEALVNWKIISAMKLPIVTTIESQRPRLILDAIFGTGLTQPPRDPFPATVIAMQNLGAPILAVDIPSGLDCDTGKPLGPLCVKAACTVTFVAQKIGFQSPEAKAYTGEIIVGDIGCPHELVEEFVRQRD